jgi:CHAD domain-containing protein
MKFCLRTHRSGSEPGRTSKEVAGGLADHAIDVIDREDLDLHRRVHEVRKDCKKIRGILRLLRPQFGELYRIENRAIRGAAGVFSDFRDATAAIECFDDLIRYFNKQIVSDGMGPLRDSMVDYRKEYSTDPARLPEGIREFRIRLMEARARIECWELDGLRLESMAGGMSRTYRRGRSAMAAACGHPSPSAFHNWRKRAKYLWYHARLLRQFWKPVMKAYGSEVGALAACLGDAHDLVVLRDFLLREINVPRTNQHIQALLGLMEARRSVLHDQAKRLGTLIYAESPKAFRDRILAYIKS